MSNPIKKLNLTEARKLQKKAKAEAQRAIDKVYKKHDKAMRKAIADALPKGWRIVSGNGMVIVVNEKNEELDTGRAWGLRDDNAQLNWIAYLQYNREFHAGFCIDDDIEGKNKQLSLLK